MAKVFTYLVTIAGLMLLFNLAGFTTTGGAILTEFGLLNPEGVSLDNIFLIFTVSLGSVGASTLVIGYFTKSSPESFLLIGYTLTLLLFVSDMVFVVTYLNANYGDWTAVLGSLIVLPIVVGYIHAVVSWWGGKE